MSAETARTTKPLLPAQRAELLAEMKARPGAPSGLDLIDANASTVKAGERAYGESLDGAAREALKRNAQRAAA